MSTTYEMMGFFEEKPSIEHSCRARGFRVLEEPKQCCRTSG